MRPCCGCCLLIATGMRAWAMWLLLGWVVACTIHLIHLHCLCTCAPPGLPLLGLLLLLL